MKIVIVTTRFPYLLGSPDSFTVYQLIRHLSKEHEVYLVSLMDSDINEAHRAEMNDFCEKIIVAKHSKWRGMFSVLIRAFNKRPMQVNYFYNRKLKKIVDKLVQEIKPDIVYSHLLRAAPYSEDIKEIPKVLALQISHILNYERLLKYSRSIKDRIIYTIELFLLKKYEPKIIKSYDKCLLISKFDKKSIDPENVLDNIFYSPHGIDTEYYSRNDFGDTAEPENPTILFPANFSPATNRDAADWLLSDIYPKIKEKIPNVRLILAGKNPAKFLYDAAHRDPSIEVTGFVEDIREYFVKSTILVNPVRACAGMQNKVLSGFCMGLPVVATHQANEGINAIEDEAILLATSNDSSELVNKSIMLLKNSDKRIDMASKARKFVTEYWTWECHFIQLEEMFLELIEND